MPCLRVCVRVWVCPQLSPSLCFAQLDQPLPSFFSASFFVHIPPRSASFSYLLLTANVRPLCPVLYSDLPWWSSIRTSFNLLGSNWSRDCVWLYCFRWDTNQNKTSLLSSAAVSLKNLSAFFFFSFLPSPPSSINLVLSPHQVRETHTHTHTHTLLPATRWFQSSVVMTGSNNCDAWRALQSATPLLVSGFMCRRNFNHNSWDKLCCFPPACLSRNKKRKENPAEPACVH